MVYDITTNGGREENSHLRSQFPANSPQNTKLSTEEPPSQKIDYPPFVDQVHGLSLALLSKSRKLRIFWWLVFFVCTSCGIVTTVLVIIEYIQVPTVTSITIKLVPSLELPAITVCPSIPDALDYKPLFNNIQTRLPDITNETAIDLIHFWLGGSGLGSIAPLTSFNQTYLDQLGKMFTIWSDGYDTQSFFGLIQTKYGYKCEELFAYCELGAKARDCCKELFRPIWVVAQGVCYQTRRNTNQTETDGFGRLYVGYKAPPSITTSVSNNTQPALFVYINDNFEHVITSPRFYLLPGDTNILHLTARLVELLEHPQDCTNKVVGKDASCFVKNWLTTHLLDPFNCTVPYLKNIPGVPKDTKICDPVTIAKDYYNATNMYKIFENRKCIPGCTKWEYGIWLETRATRVTDPRPYFLVGFDDLQYEHLKEVSTISISGLISQIGGQFGLFLGLSIITMFQIVIYGVNMVVRFFSRLSRLLPVGPNVNKNEYTMHRVDDRGLHYDRAIISYV